MTTLPLFATFALHFTTYKYPLIFLGTMIEGPFLMIACGFLLHIWMVELVPLFLSVILGDLVWDALWYGIGRYFLHSFVTKFGHYFGVNQTSINKVTHLFHTYKNKILFISKITVGFGAALGVLMVAGASRISFRKFLWINFLGECLLIAVLFSLGYFLWAAYTTVSDTLKYYFLAGLFVIIPTILYFLHRYFKHKILDVWSHL